MLMWWARTSVINMVFAPERWPQECGFRVRDLRLLAGHQRAEQLPALALEPHHLKLLERGEIGRTGLDPGARKVDADLEIQVRRLLHDVFAGEVVLALAQHLLESLG